MHKKDSDIENNENRFKEKLTNKEIKRKLTCFLNKTEAAVDPKTPIRDSRVKELFKKQTKNTIGSVYMEDLNNGAEYVSNLIREKVEAGARIIILTAAVLRKKVKLDRQSAHKILAVVGSVNPVARR